MANHVHLHLVRYTMSTSDPNKHDENNSDEEDLFLLLTCATKKRGV